MSFILAIFTVRLKYVYTEYFHLSYALVQVTELATVKSTLCRVQALSSWHRKGGVMITSYEMYRILTHGKNAKYAKHQQTLQTALQNPGTNLLHCALWNTTCQILIKHGGHLDLNLPSSIQYLDCYYYVHIIWLNITVCIYVVCTFFN